jgi:TPR repeat protein
MRTNKPKKEWRDMSNYTHLRAGDESYYGLNGLRVDYEAAEGAYELTAKETEDPRAELMLALCCARLYSGEEKTITRLLKKAAKGGDEYARRWLETGKRAEPPMSWGIKTSDVITEKKPDSNSEELCKLAQNYFDAYEKAHENGRRRDERMNLIKARYYAGLAVEAEEKTAGSFLGSNILESEAYDLQTHTGRLLWSYADDDPEPDDETCAESQYFTELQDKAERADAYMEAKEYAKALPLLLELAEAGIPKAMLWLGHINGYGHGVFRDWEQARYWWNRATESADEECTKIAAENLEALDKQEADEKALELLEQVSHSRSAGDYSKSIALLREAAQLAVDPEIKGNAETTLACMYVEGLGVPVDMAKAGYWLTRAVGHGNKDALEMMKAGGK